MSHRYQPTGGYDPPYHPVDDNYGSSADLATKSAGYDSPVPMHTHPASRTRGAVAYRKPWYKKPIVLWGVPIALVVVIAAAVAGGVVASRTNHDMSSSHDAGTSHTNGRGSGIQNNAAASLDVTSMNSKYCTNPPDTHVKHTHMLCQRMDCPSTQQVLRLARALPPLVPLRPALLAILSTLPVLLASRFGQTTLSSWLTPPGGVACHSLSSKMPT